MKKVSAYETKHIVSSDTDCYDTATAAIALTEPEKHSALIILEGKCADSKITADIRSYISEKYPKLETYINYGGQDIYDYIKYMSVCSCVSSLSCPVILAILGAESPAVLVLSALSALLVIARHKENFKRLKEGTETKFSLTG